MSQEIKNLSKKILAAIGSIGALKKDKRNDFHNYQYASDEMIVGAIREALIKCNIMIFPSQKSCSEITIKTSKGEDQVITKLEMEFLIIDIDSGENRISTFFGYGADKGDKGIYKAATGAEKYFFMKQFLIATPDDPEFDKTQRNIGNTFSKNAAPLAIKASNDKLSEDILIDIEKKLGELSRGDMERAASYVKQWTTWIDPQTKQEKWKKPEDLIRIAERNPDWLKTIHKKVKAEFEKTFSNERIGA